MSKRRRKRGPPRGPDQPGNLHEPFLRRSADATDGVTSGIALGAFLTLRLIDALRTARDVPLERYAYQITATRDYLHDLHPDDPEVTQLAGHVQAVAEAFERDDDRVVWPSLRDYALWLEQAGRFDEALDVVVTALDLFLEAGAERAAALLVGGRLFTRLRRFEEAIAALAESTETAQSTGDRHLAQLGAVGRGVVLRESGDPAASEVTLRDVTRAAEPGMDIAVWARYELARTLMVLDKTAEAQHELERALVASRDEGGDVIRLTLGEALARQGMHSDVLAVVEPLARSGESAERRVSAARLLLHAAVATEDRIAFRRWRNVVEELLPALGPAERVETLTEIADGLARFGARGAAAREAEAALRIADGERLDGAARRARRVLDLVRD